MKVSSLKNVLLSYTIERAIFMYIFVVVFLKTSKDLLEIWNILCAQLGSVSENISIWNVWNKKFEYEWECGDVLFGMWINLISGWF